MYASQYRTSSKMRLQRYLDASSSLEPGALWGATILACGVDFQRGICGTLAMARKVFWPLTLLLGLSAATLLWSQQQIPTSARPASTTHRQNQTIRANPTQTG